MVATCPNEPPRCAVVPARSPLRAALRAAVGPGAGPTSPLAELLAVCLRQAVLRAKPKYVREIARVVGGLLATGGIYAPAEVNPAAIRAHLASLRQRGLSDTTVRCHRSILSGFCEFLIEQGVLASNPARAIRLRPPYVPPPVLLPQPSFRSALRRSRGPLHVAICLAGVCGLRLSEIIALAPSSIFIDLARAPGGHILIQEAVNEGQVSHPKGRRWRVVPLPPSLARVLLRALRRLPPGSPRLLRARTCEVYCRDLARLVAELPGFKSRPGTSVGRLWHALRAYAAMTKARGGMGPLQLMAEMGWQDWRVAMRYIQLAALSGPARQAACNSLVNSLLTSPPPVL